MIVFCQLPDLFVEAWNLSCGVIVNCCDIKSMNCDIKNSEISSILDVENSSDIKHDSQHGSFCQKNATGHEHKKLKISWKSLTNFFSLVNEF